VSNAQAILAISNIILAIRLGVGSY
jgi:hypothetical protein